MSTELSTNQFTVSKILTWLRSPERKVNYRIGGRAGRIGELPLVQVEVSLIEGLRLVADWWDTSDYVDIYIKNLNTQESEDVVVEDSKVKVEIERLMLELAKNL
jgi:hypothetical protein